MKKLIGCGLVCLSLTMGVAAQSSRDHRTYVTDGNREWTLGFGGAGRTQLLPSAVFCLRNSSGFLGYGERDCGINLKWYSAASKSAFAVSRFHSSRDHQDGSGPLRYGETVALKEMTRERYVRYGIRDNGINLVWDDEPAYDLCRRSGTR